MNRRTFVAAAPLAAAAPLTSAGAADPALAAAQALQDSTDALEAFLSSPAGVEISDGPLPFVVMGMAAKTGKPIKARSVKDIEAEERCDPRLNPQVRGGDLVYQTTSDETRVQVRQFYTDKRSEFQAAVDAEKELKRVSGFDAIRKTHIDAKEAAGAVRPTTSAGAAALLSAIGREWEADDLPLANIIEALEGMG